MTKNFPAPILGPGVTPLEGGPQIPPAPGRSQINPGVFGAGAPPPHPRASHPLLLPPFSREQLQQSQDRGQGLGRCQNPSGEELNPLSIPELFHTREPAGILFLFGVFL